MAFDHSLEALASDSDEEASDSSGDTGHRQRPRSAAASPKGKRDKRRGEAVRLNNRAGSVAIGAHRPSFTCQVSVV